ncbi:hypothetical protein ACFE04_005501 [Oxalis oulophora]
MSSREMSTMLKQGFISDPTLSSSISLSPSRPNNQSKSILFISNSPQSKTLINPPSPSPNPSIPDSPLPARPESNRPTLFEMMSVEQLRESTTTTTIQDKSRARVAKILTDFNYSIGGGSGDVRLTVIGRDGFRVSLDVHKRVLSHNSRFFAEKLKGVVSDNNTNTTVEISECDDVEVYVEVIVLMYYSQDLKRRLMGEHVARVLALLKVSAAVMFDAGIISCLEYLEAVPWSEDEEEKVISHLSQLQLDDSLNDVLQRVLSEPCSSSRADDIFLKLFTGILEAKDDKARREMKTVISRLLREEPTVDESRQDISKDMLYSLCHRCVTSLVLWLSEATSVKETGHDRGALMGEISREADNLQWIVDILINKKIGEEFVKLWADQKELAILHSKIPTMYRHEISRITAQLCVAIGRGFILVPKETRYSLLSTWLEALYDDFGWMKRAGRPLDRKLVEDGLSQTILTLPLVQQQAILLNWFDRFLNKGDDCPNIQRAFEVWWRRAFIRQYGGEQENSQLQITVYDYPT